MGSRTPRFIHIRKDQHGELMSRRCNIERPNINLSKLMQDILDIALKIQSIRSSVNINVRFTNLGGDLRLTKEEDDD